MEDFKADPCYANKVWLSKISQILLWIKRVRMKMMRYYMIMGWRKERKNSFSKIRHIYFHYKLVSIPKQILCLWHRPEYSFCLFLKIKASVTFYILIYIFSAIAGFNFYLCLLTFCEYPLSELILNWFTLKLVHLKYSSPWSLFKSWFILEKLLWH